MPTLPRDARALSSSLAKGIERRSLFPRLLEGGDDVRLRAPTVPAEQPCGFGAKGRTPSAGWTERHGKAKSISPRAHGRARKTGPTARADACFDATRAELGWGHPDGGTWTLFGSLTLAIGRGCKRESRTQRAGFSRKRKGTSEQGKGTGIWAN